VSQYQLLSLPTAVLLINITGIPPLAGTLGQQVRSYLPSAGAVSLSNNAATTITSIALTPGIWDITGIASFTTSGSLTITTMIAGLSIVGNGFVGNAQGDNTFNSNAFPVSGADQPIYIPAYRVNLASNQTYYLIGLADFSLGSISAYGRISAVRVC
jgi:hypothetical protein